MELRVSLAEGTAKLVAFSAENTPKQKGSMAEPGGLSEKLHAAEPDTTECVLGEAVG